MKKIRIMIPFLLAAVMLVAACNKNNSATPAAQPAATATAADQISTADVSEAVKNAVSGSASGMATQSEQTAALAANAKLACGSTVDSTISGASPSWWLLTWSYDLNYRRTCICTGGTPSQYNTTITGSSSYSGIFMSSQDSTNAQISVSGIQVAATSYVLNGTYTRTGAMQSLISDQHSFTGAITITSNNINVSKSSSQITSGTATAQFSGVTQSGATVSHTANITFLGNNQATLSVDNGTASTISW